MVFGDNMVLEKSIYFCLNHVFVSSDIVSVKTKLWWKYGSNAKFIIGKNMVFGENIVFGENMVLGEKMVFFFAENMVFGEKFWSGLI